MKAINKFFKKIGVLLVVILVLMVAYLSDISLSDILNAFEQLSWLELIVILSWSVAIMIIDAVMRIYLLRQMGYDSKIRDVILIHFASMSAHYSTPVKIGFPVMAILFKKVCNVKYTDTAIMISVGLVSSLGLAGLIAFLGSVFYYAQDILLISMSLLVGLVCLVGGIIIIKKLKSRNDRVQRILDNLQNGFHTLKPTTLATYIGLRIVSIFLYAVLFTTLIGYMESNLGIFESVVATSSSYFIGAISMVPMGLGINEATLGFYLNNMGVAQTVIVGVLILQRAFSTVLGFLLGVLSSLILGVKSFTDAES